MKRCAYCGRYNWESEAVCSECGKRQFQASCFPGTDSHLGPAKTSRRRGIKFLVGGVLGGTLLVVILSAAFHDWSYLGRWATGLAVIVLVGGYLLGKRWLMMRAIRVAQQELTTLPQERGAEDAERWP